MKIEAKEFQFKFLTSEKRYPALIAAIGTGKTMMLLLKIWNFCQKYPNTLALIVRKEYTDLRDSTIKDFMRYFNTTVDSDKEYHFENGSIIMFRHGSELNVLKNINLTIIGIEQAEEFESEEVFTFLRDRLRRDNAPLRQLCIIGNVNGHNWIWRLWKNNPPNEEFDLTEARTFDNEDNLPKDFTDDLKRMEVDSPNHYRRFVLNDWEEAEGDDYLFTWQTLHDATALTVPDKDSVKLIGLDVARFGEDETVFTVLQHRGYLQWEQVYIEAHQKKDIMWTIGRGVSLRRETHSRLVVVDDVGVGGGVTDGLREAGIQVIAFQAGAKPKDEVSYGNSISEAYFNLKILIDSGYLKLQNDPKLIDQLLTIRYKFTKRGQKLILSKDEMRKEGIKSPDRAEALAMATMYLDRALRQRRDMVLEAPKMY